MDRNLLVKRDDILAQSLCLNIVTLEAMSEGFPNSNARLTGKVICAQVNLTRALIERQSPIEIPCLHKNTTSHDEQLCIRSEGILVQGIDPASQGN